MEKFDKIKKYLVSLLFLVFIAAFAVLLAVLPKKASSENEKRVLASFPQVTFSSVAEGEFSEDLDTFFADQFPFRDFFVGVNSYFELFTGRNGASGVYKADDGYLISAPADFDPAQAKLNTERFDAFANELGLPAALMIVPNAGYILEDKLPDFHEVYHDADIFDIAEENKGNLKLIDVRGAFLGEKDMQLYYKTDHHITGSGSLVLYERFCDAMDMDPAQFTLKQTHEGFYGTTYSRSGLWLTKADTIELWEAEDGSYTVTIEDGGNVKTADSLFFTEHFEKMDHYPVYLDGNHSLVKIENNNCRNGKKLLLIKDSYAHCFATFAIENYEEICMVDLRYYRDSVQELVQREGLTEILFLYGADNFSASTDTAWLMPGN